MHFLSKLKRKLVHILSCCDEPESLQIGYPTDFRCEDVTCDLTQEYQAFLREKASTDVLRTLAGNIPSPNSSPTFDHHMGFLDQPSTPSRLDQVREHTRKLSGKLYGYQSEPYTDSDPEKHSIVAGSMLHEQPLSQHPVNPLDDFFAKPAYAQSKDSITIVGAESSVSDKTSTN